MHRLLYRQDQRRSMVEASQLILAFADREGVRSDNSMPLGKRRGDEGVGVDAAALRVLDMCAQRYVSRHFAFSAVRAVKMIVVTPRMSHRIIAPSADMSDNPEYPRIRAAAFEVGTT